MLHTLNCIWETLFSPFLQHEPGRMVLDGDSDSSIWKKLAKIFLHKSTDNVEQAIREASEEGQLDEEEGTMLLSILELDELQVQDIMTPRTDITCAPVESTIREVAELIINTGHSRIPLYRENRDNIVGIVHAKDLLLHSLDAETQVSAAASVMREPFFVPETKNILDLLQEFRDRKQHLAVILDEYGGTAGLVSIEDVLEQIVGDIEDEYDAPREDDIVPLEDNVFLISGRTDLEDLAEELDLKVESDEVDTIGGYLSHLAGRVPKPGECFTIADKRFTVQDADAKQVRTIKVDAVPEDGSDTCTRLSA